MFVNIGARRRSEALLDLLLACHERIRYFLALAKAAAERDDASDRDRSEACAQALRYFTEALPLHVADEEESILPRLTGKDAELDAALLRMRAQHAEHSPLLAEFAQALQRVESAPAELCARERLLPVLERLTRELELHLADEESQIFTKLSALLTRDEEAEIRSELRARREGSAAPPHPRP